MRTVIRYDSEGHKVWSDSTPSSVISQHIRGSLVIGGPGPNDVDKRRAEIARYKSRKAAEAQA